jgi:hypothetical protein
MHGPRRDQRADSARDEPVAEGGQGSPNWQAFAVVDIERDQHQRVRGTHRDDVATIAGSVEVTPPVNHTPAGGYSRKHRQYREHAVAAWRETGQHDRGCSGRDQRTEVPPADRCLSRC